MALRASRAAWSGIVILAVIVLAAIAAPLLSPYGPVAQHLAERRIPPVWHAWLFGDARAGWAHPLGTDRVGRDYFTRLAVRRAHLAAGRVLDRDCVRR